MSDRTIVMAGNKKIQVIDAEKAFGGDFPQAYRDLLIRCTAKHIATIELLKGFQPLIIPDGFDPEVVLQECRRGLTALGVQDVQAEIDKEVEELTKLDPSQIAQKVAKFMQ